jgi:hypothetical protein
MNTGFLIVDDVHAIRDDMCVQDFERCPDVFHHVTSVVEDHVRCSALIQPDADVIIRPYHRPVQLIKFSNLSAQPLPNRPASLDDSTWPGDFARLAHSLYRPIVFQEPERIVHPPSWLEHIPFAFWIVEAMRPATFVELGTQSGNSYASFAQAVQMLGLSTACYSIDTWEGDSQTGFYREDVFKEWAAYHDHHFSSFSRLIRSTFSEAAGHFPDGSIDLLHSDGCHTYDAATADLEIWRPKLSRNGVILIHDINVRERDFGAWRLWEELKDQSPSFTFLHGHGLGVLGVGSELPESLRWLFSASEESTSLVRQFFARTGALVSARFVAADSERESITRAASTSARIADLEQQLVCEREEHEDVLLHKERLVAELQEQVRHELEQRQRVELARENQEAAISRLTTERTVQEATISRLTDELTQLTSESSTLRELVAELSERLGRESALRRQAESERDRLTTVLGQSSAPMQSRWRRAAHELSTIPSTAEKVGLRFRGGIHAIAVLREFLGRPRKLREANRIVASGLFDEAHYLRCYPDVARSRMSPLAHFVLRGADEERNPQQFFDTGYYLRRNPDVALSGINPLAHYAVLGAFEGRRSHPLFDPAYYLAANPDVRNARIEPLGHFLRLGGVEGRNPNLYFDSAYYLWKYPDVAKCGANPLMDFQCDGWRKGRNPSPFFDTAFYLSQNPDVRALGSNPLEHYIEWGRRQGRDTVDPAQSRDPAFKTRGLSEVRMRPSALRASGPEKPTILCLSHVMPWPPRAGNEYRIYRMLRWFRDQGYRIVPVIAPLPGERGSDDDVRSLADEFSNAVLCDRDGRLEYVLRDVPDNLSSLARQPARPVAALLGEDFVADEFERKLLHIDRTFCHDAVVTAVLHLQSVLGRHVFIAEYIWMSRIMPLVSRDVLKVVDTIDVFSTKRQKVLQFGVDDVDITPREEVRRLQDVDLVLAIQDDECRELQRLLPGKPVLTVGVDFDVVDDAGTLSGRSILYVASDNPLNEKGLRDFLRFAWPHVRRAVPDAELLLAGRVSHTAARDVAGVVRLGHVADLAPLYARARLVINPAVAGTGLKIKTLEALTHLRPIVTWPNGAEGLHPELASLCVIVSDWYEFAHQVMNLLAAEPPRLFSGTERDAVVRLTSPTVAYGALRDALTEFLTPHERRP